MAPTTFAATTLTTENFLYACNQSCDSVVTFRIDGNGRHLSFHDQYTPVESPVVMAFLVI